MNVNAIGENAGIVWRALHGKNLSWEELIENTKLDPLTLACAIGWLVGKRKQNHHFPSGWYYLFRDFPRKLLLTRELMNNQFYV